MDPVEAERLLQAAEEIGAREPQSKAVEEAKEAEITDE